MDSEKNLRKNYYVFPREWITPEGKKRKVYLVQFRDPINGKLLPAKSSRLANATAAENWAAARWAEMASHVQFSQGLTPEARAFAEGSCSSFFASFWAEGSQYIKDRIDARKPLSEDYLYWCRYYVARFVADYEPFCLTALQDFNLLLAERFVKDLKDRGEKPGIINHVLDTIRTPANWALARGMIRSSFKFSGIVRPKTDEAERGVFSEDELLRICSLPAVERTMPRPRLPRAEGGPRKQTDLYLEIDIRMKAAALLGYLAGLRRSEMRALKWNAIDFERKILYCRASYTDRNGWRPRPKAGSFGILPIADDLLPILKDLHAVAEKYERANAEDYALFDYDDPKVPISEKAIQRGFTRILRQLGISEAQKKERNLVFHGTRHSFATKMNSALGADDAMKMTRHKNRDVFETYAGHVQPELIEKARKALKIKGKKGGKNGDKSH